MKQKLSILTMALAFMASAGLMAFGLQQGNGKGKNDKGQQQGQGNGNQKANDNKGKPDKVIKMNQGQGNQDKAYKGQGNGNANKGQEKNYGKGNDIIRIKDNNGNNDKPYNVRGKVPRIGGDNWYTWNRENFRDRKEYRNKGKVTICHKFRSNEEPVTISVSENAMKAHMAHGDVVGDCPAVTNSTWSDIFRRKRADYYNDLYYSQDQYYYSNSVLDYALMRLADSRSQLDYMRLNNYPQADIDRREAAVLGLEQNVSLLETVLSVAGQYLVNRLL